MTRPLTTKSEFASLASLLVVVLLVLTPILHVHPLVSGHGDRGNLTSESALCALCACGTNAIVEPIQVPMAIDAGWTGLTLSADPVASSCYADSLSSRGPPQF